MELHILKTLPEHFDAVRRGVKRAELRRDDRGFSVGDVLALVEYASDGEQASGNVLLARIIHIYRGEYLAPGYAMLSLADVSYGFIDFRGEYASIT